jgi:hypothetical protein
MERKILAQFWRDPDGTRCILSKDDAGWQLTVERDGKALKAQTLATPAEAITLAPQWRRSTQRASKTA